MSKPLPAAPPGSLAEALLAAVPLAGRPVTGDALLAQRDLCAQIVAGGGASLLPVDDNQPALLAAVAAAFPHWGATGAEGWGSPLGPPWLVAELARLGGGTAVTWVEPKVRHGRRERRQLWVLADPALNACAGEAGAHGTP